MVHTAAVMITEFAISLAKLKITVTSASFHCLLFCLFFSRITWKLLYQFFSKFGRKVGGTYAKEETIGFWR